MADEKWEELGEKVSHIVDDAVKEGNYSSLNETISRILGDAIDSGSDVLRSALDKVLGDAAASGGQGGTPAQNAARGSAPLNNGRNPADRQGAQLEGLSRTMHEKFRSRPKKKELFADVNRPTVRGGLFTIGGGVLILQAGIQVVKALVTGGLGGFFGIFGFAVSMVLGGCGVYLFIRGRETMGKVRRFFKYQEVLGDRSYADIKKLAAAVGKKETFVCEDLSEMIRSGWFLEGHLDEERTTLIVTEETWQQYLASHEGIVKAAEQDRQKKASMQKQDPPRKLPAEAQELLDKGNAYLDQLHRCNDRIPGEEISAKISRMEVLVQRIFDRVRTNPEVIPDLKKMMNYYLPTTIKLLEAYQDLDTQPVEGENIKKAKQEIEQTLDTLNEAFERLLDAIFQDTAWDVSTDISVLNTMLAQEGLAGQADFAKGSSAAGRTAGASAGSSAAMAQAPAATEEEKKITLTLEP